MDDPSAQGRLRPVYLVHQKLLEATAKFNKTQNAIDTKAADFAASEGEMSEATQKASEVSFATNLFTQSALLVHFAFKI